MKELSIEEKAKRYDEAINAIKELKAKHPTTHVIKDWIKENFPELAESEDEKIRKWLICTLKSLNNSPVQIDGAYEMMLPAIDWLEKQGQQKPADKVEPKFHKGEWVFIEEVKGYKNGPFQIKTVDSFGYSFDKYHTIPFIHEDILSKWTIEDGKDGDVLCDYCEGYDNPLIFILKKFERVDFGLVKPSDYSSYCFLTAGDKQIFKEGEYHHKHNIKPATKEQRELLFQKMHEAGYEWDAEKKELEKIEQKPVDSFIEEEKPLLEKFKQAVYDCAWGKVTCKKEGETKEEYANRWAEHFLLMVRDWADDYIDFTIQQKLRNSYEKGKADIIEQKPAWSEEDEVNLNEALSYIKDDALKEFIKSLKDRVQSQPKQEWSEEDENAVKVLMDIIKKSEIIDSRIYTNPLKE